MRIALLFALTCSLCSAAAPQAPAMISEGSGSLDIDTLGMVESVSLATGHGEQVDRVIIGKMKQWRFEPVRVDGQVRSVRAHMRFLLSARPVEGSEALQLSIADVDFVDPRLEAKPAARLAHVTQPPVYPREMISRRLGARLELAVELDADGSVLRAAPVQGWLIGRPVQDKLRDKYMAQFVKASTHAVKTWRFEPPAPGEALVYTPFVFSVSESTAAADFSQWQPATAIEFAAEPWMQTRAGEGVALAADGSRLRHDLTLLTPLDG